MRSIFFFLFYQNKNWSLNKNGSFSVLLRGYRSASGVWRSTPPLPQVATRLSRGGVHTSERAAWTFWAVSTLRGRGLLSHPPALQTTAMWCVYAKEGWAAWSHQRQANISEENGFIFQQIRGKFIIWKQTKIVSL